MNDSILGSAYFAGKIGYVQEIFNYDLFIDNINKTPVKFGNNTLLPGELTTLDNYYNLAPIKYVGYLDKWLFFYLGESNSKHYFEKHLLLNSNKLFIIHSGNGGREYNFIKGQWDWNRRENRYKK